MTFLNHFCSEMHKVVFKDKATAPLMKLVALLIAVGNRLKICDIRNFITDYVTTIGNRIYAHPRWNYATEPSPLVLHELTHVVFWSTTYALRYLLSKKWRLYYESVCIQTEMMCFTRCRSNAYIKIKARMLEGYGIRYSDAVNELAKRLHEVETNRHHPEAAKVYYLYADWQRLMEHVRLAGSAHHEDH